MSAAPDTVNLKSSRDRQNWWQSVWIRRLLLLVLVIIVAFGLADAFGQRPSVATTAAPEARLTITAPTHARSGLIYAVRFRIDALKDLRRATLVLESGWANGYTVNGQAPQPLTQGSTDGYPRSGPPTSSSLSSWATSSRTA